MCLLCDEAKRLSSCREEGELVILYFDGWPFVEAEKRFFKEAKDFREYPRLFDKFLTHYRLPKFERKDEKDLKDEDKNS